MSRQSTLALCVVYAFSGLLGGLGTVYAQSAPDALVIGEPVTVTLDGNGPAELAYTTAEAQTITITAHSLEPTGTIDVTLEMIGPDGVRVPGGFSDADQPDADSETMADLRLPDPGTYILRVDSFNGVSQGKVRVSIEKADIFGETVVSDNGQTHITATLPAFAIYRYTFQGTADQIITLTARDMSGTLDPVLTLRDPGGQIVAQNDDHAPSPDLTLDTFDAQIIGITLPESGDYTVEVRDFVGEAGRFELTIAVSS